MPRLWVRGQFDGRDTFSKADEGLPCHTCKIADIQIMVIN